jgi:hypothetical protein
VYMRFEPWELQPTAQEQRISHSQIKNTYTRKSKTNTYAQIHLNGHYRKLYLDLAGINFSAGNITGSILWPTLGTYTAAYSPPTAEWMNPLTTVCRTKDAI